MTNIIKLKIYNILHKILNMKHQILNIKKSLFFIYYLQSNQLFKTKHIKCQKYKI